MMELQHSEVKIQIPTSSGSELGVLFRSQPMSPFSRWTVMYFLWFCLICIWLPLIFHKWLLPSWLLQILQVEYYGGMTLYFYVFFFSVEPSADGEWFGVGWGVTWGLELDGAGEGRWVNSVVPLLISALKLYRRNLCLIPSVAIWRRPKGVRLGRVRDGGPAG
jgi:hypothetical protein